MRKGARALDELGTRSYLAAWRSALATSPEEIKKTFDAASNAPCFIYSCVVEVLYSMRVRLEGGVGFFNVACPGCLSDKMSWVILTVRPLAWTLVHGSHCMPR